jgi:hypothetical protein
MHGISLGSAQQENFFAGHAQHIKSVHSPRTDDELSIACD